MLSIRHTATQRTARALYLATGALADSAETSSAGGVLGISVLSTVIAVAGEVAEAEAVAVGDALAFLVKVPSAFFSALRFFS